MNPMLTNGFYEIYYLFHPRFFYTVCIFRKIINGSESEASCFKASRAWIYSVLSRFLQFSYKKGLDRV